MKKLLNYLVLAWLAFSWAKANAQETLTVIDHNSLHGFNGDTAKRTSYAKWIAQLAPDVVLFQEMIDVSKQELTAFAKKYGHAYSVIMSRETGYDVTHPIAITARYPITSVEMKNEDMWHGYVYAKIKNIHFFATHLAPFTLKDRQKDIDVILQRISLLPKNEPVLVGGDFNALARFDAANYGSELLKSLQKFEGRLEPKSGTPIVKNKIIYRNNLNNGEIDFSVTDKMTNAGFIDAYYALHQSFKNSVPVKSQLKKTSILRRVDYIWVNEALSAKLLAADIIQDNTTDAISDHYPVMAKIKVK
jgi:exodeoxyribonuclease-3